MMNNPINQPMMRKSLILILFFFVLPLSGCSNRVRTDDIIEASDAIQQLYVDIDDPVTTIQATIFSSYMHANRALLDEDDLRYGTNRYTVFMSRHTEFGYFPGEDNQFYNLDEINPDHKRSFSYDGHDLEFTREENIITYTISGPTVNDTALYDLDTHELLGTKLTWEDFYQWIASNELNVEGRFIRLIDDNMVAVTKEYGDTMLYFMDIENELLYYMKVSRDTDTRVGDIRLFRIPFDRFITTRELPSNPGSEDIWIKTKKLPDQLGAWEDFLQDQGNYIQRHGDTGIYTNFLDPSNHFDGAMELFSTYFGTSTLDTSFTANDTNGPEFALREDTLILQASDNIDEVDLIHMIDPTKTPEYYYPEEFYVTIHIDPSGESDPGDYIVTYTAEDSLGNETTKTLVVIIE